MFLNQIPNMERRRYFTSGFKVAISQIGRHGSKIAIAVVETNIAPAICTIIVSDRNNE